MTDRVIEAVSYIVRRIAAEDDVEGLDVEIVDRLLGSGFSHEEISAAFRFLSSVAGGEETSRPAGPVPRRPVAAGPFAAGPVAAPRALTAGERLLLDDEAEALWEAWTAAGVLRPGEADEILRRAAARPPGDVGAEALRRIALSTVAADSPLRLYLAEAGPPH